MDSDLESVFGPLRPDTAWCRGGIVLDDFGRSPRASKSMDLDLEYVFRTCKPLRGALRLFVDVC